MINFPSPSDPNRCNQQKTYEKGEKEDPSAELSEISEDCFTDILSSDSDDSSIEEIKTRIMSLRTTNRLIGETVEEEEEEIPEGEESLERTIFYSMYLDDDFNTKEEPDIEPQTSDGYDNYRPYTGIESYIKDQEAQQYIWGQMENEEFDKLMDAGLKDELGLEDIDGNVSIKTLADNNFQILGMDGPTRKIALIFDYRPEEGSQLIKEFIDFMNNQKEIFPYIGGVLLLYEEIGIHVIEGSEYVLLRHFPNFFKDQVFLKLINCKVLGIEELSAMKSFKQYACYKGFPPKLKGKMPEKISTYSDSIKFLQKLGKRLNMFLKFVYSDNPSVLEDNKIPEDVTLHLPPNEYLYFALKGDWTPGLRSADEWFENAIVLATEADDSEFVFPPRSDHLPVHILHTTIEEDENLKKATTQEMKSVKLPCTSDRRKEEKVEIVQKKDEFGNPIHPFTEAIENLLDPEYEYPPEVKSRPEDFSEGEKGYNSQSSVVDPEDIDTDLEDYLEHIESIKM